LPPALVEPSTVDFPCEPPPPAADELDFVEHAAPTSTSMVHARKNHSCAVLTAELLANLVIFRKPFDWGISGPSHGGGRVRGQLVLAGQAGDMLAQSIG
jgi:hypothetical protein